MVVTGLRCPARVSGLDGSDGLATGVRSLKKMVEKVVNSVENVLEGRVRVQYMQLNEASGRDQE